MVEKVEDKKKLIQQRKELDEKIKIIEATEPKVPPMQVEVKVTRLVLLIIFVAGYLIGKAF